MALLSLDDDYRQLHSSLAAHQQEHVLRWWPDLGPDQRASLLRQLNDLDLEQLAALFQEKPSKMALTAIRPAPIHRLPETFEEWTQQEEATQIGEQSLRAGQVAVLVVAGGQGTRLGFEGPKGTFPIGPVSKKSLFQLHAEKIRALNRRYKTSLPLCVMTSQDNDAATRQFFSEHGSFGLDPADVTFFEQGTMPALDHRTGKLLLADKGQIATSPNGHGGVLQALADHGRLKELSRRGVRYLYYFQVDNPLAKIADAGYLGHHIEAGAEMSLKVVAKTGPQEKVGNVVEIDGRMQVIEYMDLPDDLAQRRTAEGRLEIWAGSIAIHIFSVSFLERLACAGSILPYHRALKKASFLNEKGRLVEPAEENAVKFEMFIFDALPLARKALALETSREEEFEPVKNAEGENSPATARQAMSTLFAGWLNQAGVHVARREDGSAAVPIEISPLFAVDAEELRARLQRTEPVTEPLLLEENVMQS